jgi:hypothetical protein
LTFESTWHDAIAWESTVGKPLQNPTSARRSSSPAAPGHL